MSFGFVFDELNNKYKPAAFPFEVKYNYKYNAEDPNTQGYVTEEVINKKYGGLMNVFANHGIETGNIFYTCIFARHLRCDIAKKIITKNNIKNTIVMANWQDLSEDNHCLQYYGPSWSNLFSYRLNMI